jgi:hypothetical protein
MGADDGSSVSEYKPNPRKEWQSRSQKDQRRARVQRALRDFWWLWILLVVVLVVGVYGLFNWGRGPAVNRFDFRSGPQMGTDARGSSNHAMIRRATSVFKPHTYGWGFEFNYDCALSKRKHWTLSVDLLRLKDGQWRLDQHVVHADEGSGTPTGELDQVMSGTGPYKIRVYIPGDCGWNLSVGLKK